MNSEPETDRMYVKKKWEGFPKWLRFLILILLIGFGPIGWIAGIGCYVWLYHWED